MPNVFLSRRRLLFVESVLADGTNSKVASVSVANWVFMFSSVFIVKVPVVPVAVSDATDTTCTKSRSP